MMTSYRSLAAFGALALCAAAAPAAVVFNGTFNNALANGYIGEYRAGDSAVFANLQLPSGAFANGWVFTLLEEALVSAEAFVSAEGDPPAFDLDIFSASFSGCAPPSGGSPGACTSVVAGQLRLDGSFDGSSASTGVGQLGAGAYLMLASGTRTSPAQYSGNLVVNPVPVAQAPEPGSLALAGLALAGVAAVRRRRA